MPVISKEVFAQEAPYDNAYTNPGLIANLACRVFFAILGTLLCWVPFSLLSRNGEFAAVVLIVDVAVMNIFTIVNSLIWSSDDWDHWWDGSGLCDIEVWLQGPLQTIYAAAIFSVMRHLAMQVSLTRIAVLTRREIKRRNIVQALIIFPVPLIQLGFTWFGLAQRYNIGTLVGCSVMYDNSWPKVVVYILPPALFAVATVPYAFLTWKRFKAISKNAHAALGTNSGAASRARRSRRRLYQMSMSIFVPYLPLMIAFLVHDTLGTEIRAYDYSRVHYGNQYPWNSVMFIPSWLLPFEVINQPWISILTTIPIVLFFGMTKNAIETYSRYGKAVGLGRCFPGLKESLGQERPGISSLENSKQRWLGSGRGSRADDSHEQSEVPPKSHSASKGHQTSTFASGPPEIPPRHSSLRRGFLFRTPTLSSIRFSIRLPSIPSSLRNRNKNNSSSNVTDAATSPMIPLNAVHEIGMPGTPISFDTPTTTGGKDEINPQELPNREIWRTLSGRKWTKVRIQDRYGRRVTPYPRGSDDESEENTVINGCSSHGTTSQITSGQEF